MYQKRRTISFLSTDRAFGILTRNALELKLRNKENFTAIFVDFTGIHKLNKEFGYKEINERVRNLIESFHFRKTDIIGRWFSGDEIVIVLGGGYGKSLASRFESHCRKHKFKIKYKVLEHLKDFDELEKTITMKCNPNQL